MSTRPAIGLRWLSKYSRDLEPGYLAEDAGQHTIPRYYRKKIKDGDTDLHESIEYNIAQNRMQNPKYRNLEAAEKIHERLKYLSENRNQI